MPRTWDEIVKLLKTREQAQIERERYALQLYVCAQGSPRFHSTERLEAETVVAEFLADTDKQVLLLLGDAGAGKSLLCHRLALNTWQQDDVIPLLVPLVAIALPEKELIEQHLRKRGLESEEIVQLKQQGKFLFILDGYDELNTQANLYQTNGLQDWQAKVIISCRSQALPAQDYSRRFMPKHQPQALQELVLQPFSEEAMQHYLEKAVAQVQDLSSFSVDTYWHYLTHLASVKKLISNPFLLSLVVVALPRLVAKHNWQLADTTSYQHQQLTRSDLYDAFVEQWCERQLQKLEEQGKTTLTDGNTLTQDDFIDFNRLVATSMLERGENKLVYQAQAKSRLFTSGASQGPITEEWQSVFFSQDEKMLRLRSAWLLKKVDENTYTFLHKSLLEYFAARHLFDGILAHTAFAFGRSLNAKLLVHEPSVLQFLADKLKHDPRLAPLLWELLETSKHDPLVAIGAANAISILNMARVSFAGKDLRGIRIPGADLSGAILDSADCSEADFRNVRLSEASLDQINFSGACLEGLQLGQQAPLQFDDSVISLAYSPDGQWLAVGDERGYVYLYDKHKILVHTLKYWTISQLLDDDPIQALAFSPDSQTLAVGSRDGYIRLRHVKTGKQIRELQGHTGQGPTARVMTLSFAPDGKQLASASGSHDKTVKLWDVTSGRCTQTLVHTGYVTAVSFAPDGKQLASGSEDKTVKLWEVASGLCTQTLQGHTNSVKTLSFAPDGKQLASGSEDKTVKLWEVASGHCTHTLEGHNRDVSSVSFAPDGKQLASGSWDKNVKLWDVTSGECIQTLHGHIWYVTSVSFAPDGKQLASSGSWDKTVKLWDVGSGQCTQTLQGHIDKVTSVSLAPDGKQLASGSYDNTVKLWDVASGECTQTLHEHTHSVTSVSFAPDGKQLASGGGDHTLKLWDVASGECTQTLQGQKWIGGGINSVSFAPDGKQLASASAFSAVKLWDVASGQCIHTPPWHTDNVTSVSFAPDGKQLASSGSWDKTVKLWDVVSGQCTQTLQGHIDEVTSVSFAPDGKQLASCSLDKTVKLWDIASGLCTQTLQGHAGSVNSVSFAPDGKLLASGSWDNTVKLWDVASGQCLLTRPLASAIRSLDWQANYLVTGEESGRVSLWQIEGKRLLLRWSSHLILSVNQLTLSQATGLSAENLKLLQHYGASGQVSNQSSQEVIAARNKAERVGQACDSVFGHLPTNEAFTLTPQHWVVSLAHKKSGDGKQHAIVFLEGVDAKGYLQLRQIEFFLDTDKIHHNIEVPRFGILPRVGMLAIGQGLIQCKPKTRHDAKALLAQCVIRSEAIQAPQAKRLLEQVMADSQKPINYNTLGDNVLLVAISPFVEYDNCLTRAEKWLAGIEVQFVQERDWRTKLVPVDITSWRNYFQVPDEATDKTSDTCLVM